MNDVKHERWMNAHAHLCGQCVRSPLLSQLPTDKPLHFVRHNLPDITTTCCHENTSTRPARHKRSNTQHAQTSRNCLRSTPSRLLTPNDWPPGNVAAFEGQCVQLTSCVCVKKTEINSSKRKHMSEKSATYQCLKQYQKSSLFQTEEPLEVTRE